MGMVDRIKLHPIISASIVIDVILAIALIVGIYNNTGMTATVDILTSPSNAKVKLLGHTYRSGGAFNVKPGKYRAKVTAKGFKTKYVDIELTKDQTTKLYTILENKKTGYKYYIDNAEESKNFKKIIGFEAEKNPELKKYTILEKLPFSRFYKSNTYRDEEFTILSDPREDCEDFPCLQINGKDMSKEEAKKLASELMSENGFNIDDYEIIYHSAKGDIRL